MDEVEVLNGTLREGDRVAVAAGSKGAEMRVGTVLEIMPGIAGYNQRNGAARVRVKVDAASGLAGRSFNAATGRWEFSPFIQVYDNPHNMVKIEPAADCWNCRETA